MHSRDAGVDAFRGGWLLHLFIVLTCGFFTAVSPLPYIAHAATDTTGRSVTLIAENTLLAMSLEELMEFEITSAAKKPETLHETAAAVFVITQGDIRRSGARSLPEALRLAPGVEAIRAGNRWAVTIRGFNDILSNKLLVLIDGRTVYSPIFSGVLWEHLNVFLPDIERIEVIRGPGATLWGANAVNGVINVITTPAHKTQGALLQAGGGDHHRFFNNIRYGGAVPHVEGDLSYRVYQTASVTDGLTPAAGPQPLEEKDYNSFRAGARADWARTDDEDITFQAELFADAMDQVYSDLRPDPYRLVPTRGNLHSRGGHVLARWDRRWEAGASAIQAFYDRMDFDTNDAAITVDTFDIEAQHRHEFTERYALMAGVNFRYMSDSVDEGFVIQFDPASEQKSLFGAFVEYEHYLVPHELRLTLGARFEHNDYTGWEFQPTARLLYAPNERWSAWAAVSRAVRTPSRIDADAHIYRALAPAGVLADVPVGFVLKGDDDFRSESLVSYELGLRTRFHEDLQVNIAGYYFDYTELLAQRDGDPVFTDSPFPHAYIPTRQNNEASARTIGFEADAMWQAHATLQFQAAYSWRDIAMHTPHEDVQFNRSFTETISPEHAFSLRALWDPHPDVDVDLWWRYTDRLLGRGIAAQAFGPIEPHGALDLRVAWRPADELELALTAQDILEAEHRESPTGGVRRNVYFELTYRL